MDNNLTNDQAERLQKFKTLLEQAMKETQFTIVPRISPEGPVLNYADLKTNQGQPQNQSGEKKG